MVRKRQTTLSSVRNGPARNELCRTHYSRILDRIMLEIIDRILLYYAYCFVALEENHVELTGGITGKWRDLWRYWLWRRSLYLLRHNTCNSLRDIWVYYLPLLVSFLTPWLSLSETLTLNYWKNFLHHLINSVTLEIKMTYTVYLLNLSLVHQNTRFEPY